MYLAQIEINKNLAEAELMSKEVELKQLKGKYDEIISKLEEHKQSALV